MSTFRFQKAGREFTASRWETLAELVQRGLLAADDPISQDGAPPRPAGELPELDDAFSRIHRPEDPTAHWEQAEPELDGQVDDILTSFLDQLTTGPAPTIPDPDAPSEPAPLDPASILPLDPIPLDSASIAPLDPAPPSADRPEPALAPPPLDEPPPPILRITEPAPPDPPPAPSGEGAPPVSFSAWIEQKGDGDDLLENFGRYDDGVIVAARQRPDRLNPWRVLIAVMLGGFVILSYSVWVSTAAKTQFPTEAELERHVPGGFRSTIKPELPVREGKVDVRQRELAARAAADRALRDTLRGQILHFSNREGLEDALFQELFNAHLSPLSVSVESLELRGGTELGEVPVRSNVAVKLAAPKGAEYGDETFQRILKTAWLLLGKYQAQGRIRFQNVTVMMTDPLPWDERYKGERLMSLWNGQVAADTLFLDNR